MMTTKEAAAMTSHEFAATIRQMLSDWTDATPEHRAEALRLAALAADNVAPKVKINSSLRGRLVVFHGYDGKDYTAYVLEVRKGIATIEYKANFGTRIDRVRTYISDASRFSLPVGR